jgi:hypothetical protein
MFTELESTLGKKPHGLFEFIIADASFFRSAATFVV